MQLRPSAERTSNTLMFKCGVKPNIYLVIDLVSWDSLDSPGEGRIDCCDSQRRRNIAEGMSTTYSLLFSSLLLSIRRVFEACLETKALLGYDSNIMTRVSVS